MIISDEINVEECLCKCVKKVSIYGQNHEVEQLPISERYWTLLKLRPQWPSGQQVWHLIIGCHLCGFESHYWLS